MMSAFAARQLGQIPLFARLTGFTSQKLAKVLRTTSYQNIRREAFLAITNPNLNLVFVHFNVPHPLSIYSAQNDALSTGPSSTYIDNLRLVDRTILQLRQALERAGLWDSTSILFTSDHPLRINTWPLAERWPLTDRTMDDVVQTAEVPFMLKLAKQKSNFEYTAEMKTVVTKDLLLAILDNKVGTNEQVAQWLDAHNSDQTSIAH